MVTPTIATAHSIPIAMVVDKINTPSGRFVSVMFISAPSMGCAWPGRRWIVASTTVLSHSFVRFFLSVSHHFFILHYTIRFWGFLSLRDAPLNISRPEMAALLCLKSNTFTQSPTYGWPVGYSRALVPVDHSLTHPLQHWFTDSTHFFHHSLSHICSRWNTECYFIHYRSASRAGFRFDNNRGIKMCLQYTKW